MQVNFLSIAKFELEEAINYYNEQSDGLGFDFANEIKKTIEKIVNFVDSWPKISENTRKELVQRFPYSIIYSHEDNEVLIIAIMHLHR